MGVDDVALQSAEDPFDFAQGTILFQALQYSAIL